jgi:hypothetical protein
MKLIIKNTLAIIATTVLMASCSNDSTDTISGNGSLNVEFDNVFGDANLILDTQSNITSQNETLKISAVKYIVSNIVLTKDDGTTFTYPKSESYFIVDESDEASQLLQLANIPSGNYTKIKFGIGVDEAQFNLGATGAGDFWTKAQAKDMGWDWTSGYKFVLFEGLFTSATVTDETSFMVHTGKQAASYNYTEITLNFPEDAMVRNDITPDVHLFADVSKIIDGTNKIKLTDNNAMGMGAMIMGGANLPLVTQNLSRMFSVNHVHND